MLPGSGATTGSMVGYAMQKKFKSEEPMGTGAIEGIAASEAGNNSAAAGAFAPYWPSASPVPAPARCCWVV